MEPSETFAHATGVGGPPSTTFRAARPWRSPTACYSGDVRTLRRLLGPVALACAATLASCESPTLPVPPPSSPEVTLSADGTTARLVGGAIPGALVMIYDDDTARGVIATASSSGRWEATIDLDFSKAPANTLEIWQREGRGDSPPVTKLVYAPTK